MSYADFDFIYNSLLHSCQIIESHGMVVNMRMNVKHVMTYGVMVALLVFFSVVPPVEPLTVSGMRALGIFLATVVGWIFFGTGYISMLCIALFALFGVMTPTEAFSSSWGNWLVIFMISCFGMSEGLRATGFSRRFALWFVSRRFSRGRPWLLVAMFLLGCTLMGAVMSLTVTTIVFMAIAQPMLEGLGYKKGDLFSSMVMMGIAWAATASSSMTPIGHALNVLIINWVEVDFGITMSFAKFMMVGIPMGLAVFGLLFLIFRFVVRPDVQQFGDMTTKYIKDESSKIGPMRVEEKWAVGIFLSVVFIWISPSIFSGILPEMSLYIKNMGYAIPAVIGACLMCIIKVKDRPVVSFRDWMVNGVEWTTIALCAAVMILGAAISKEETGIQLFVTKLFEPIINDAPFNTSLMITLLWTVLQTNIMSNTVSGSLVYRIMVPATAAAGVGNPAAFAYVISAVANYAFILPSATTSTAIAVGSGWVPVKVMAKYGLLMVIPVVLLFTFIGYPFAVAVFG
jgi:solute carrier family 13 (sodium-dependent dicarboxylate transporter), member 2/3/5